MLSTTIPMVLSIAALNDIDESVAVQDAVLFDPVAAMVEVQPRDGILTAEPRAAHAAADAVEEAGSLWVN